MRCRPHCYLCISVVASVVLLSLLFVALYSHTEASEEFLLRPIELNNNNTPRWRTFAYVPQGRGDPGVVSYKDKIYAISGFFSPGFDYVDNVAVYDQLADSWEVRWNVPNPRSDIMASVVGEKIYAIGGWIADSGAQGDNHMYDPKMNTWITMTSLITPVSGAGVTVLNDKIHIIGGYDGSKGRDAVQIYDPSKNTWSLGTNMPNPRSEHGSALLNNKMYAIGGVIFVGETNTTTNSVDIYDPILDSWSAGPPMPEPRAGFAIAVQDGKIFVFGGTPTWGTGAGTDTTFIFDPDQNSWSSGDSMPTSRRSNEAAVIGNIIFVIGGAGNPGAGITNEAYGDFPHEPAVASFSASPTSGVSPLLVSFTNQSNGDYDTCLWDLGDSNTSDDCDLASYVYTEPGEYSVALMVSGPGGTDNITRTNYIAIYEPAVASFSASPTSGVSPLLVSFTNQSNGDYDTCLWDLGDSYTSDDCDLASYVYTEPGEYSVALTVSGPGGTDKITRAGYIEVQDDRFLYLPVVLKTEA